VLVVRRCAVLTQRVRGPLRSMIHQNPVVNTSSPADVVAERDAAQPRAVLQHEGVLAIEERRCGANRGADEGLGALGHSWSGCPQRLSLDGCPRRCGHTESCQRPQHAMRRPGGQQRNAKSVASATWPPRCLPLSRDESGLTDERRCAWVEVPPRAQRNPRCCEVVRGRDLLHKIVPQDGLPDARAVCAR
jgi:hypothetical protein